jgi:23S rRNA (adenine1618-N6)-methyltransferase
MQEKKRHHPKLKTQLHPRNRHNERYDFPELIKTCPGLARYVALNTYNDESIDFSDPKACKMLNNALLKHFYDITFWEIPSGYLCPPIPGRADYIHNIADVLADCNNGEIPKGPKIKCLDVGIGANCVYPIIGTKEYGWSFIGSDIDSVSIASANKIISSNECLQTKVECRLQKDSNDFFKGIIKDGEKFDITICNPPFHSSMEDAKAGTLRKMSNLQKKEVTKPVLNFGGKQTELCYDGGEERFVMEMIHQSRDFADSCLWFSTLISKLATLDSIYYALEKAKVVEIKTISMGQGNKISRIVAWTFKTKEQQEESAKERFV